VRLLGCIVDQLCDFRRQNLGYKYSEFHLQTFVCEISRVDLTIGSEQVPRIEVKREDLVGRIAWLL
jgi:hypothetical protein